MFIFGAGDLRHPFWTVPSPRIYPARLGRTSPLRVVNPGAGLRRVATFMGQETGPSLVPIPEAPPAPNRLDLLKVETILNRAFLIPAVNEKGQLPTDPAKVKAKVAEWARLNLDTERFGKAREAIDISHWNDEDLRILIAVANAPTEPEISDLGLIDAFFGPEQTRFGFYGWSRPSAIDILEARACGRKLEGERWGFGIPEKLVSTGFDRESWSSWTASNPFFCTPPSAKVTVAPGKVLVLFQNDKGLPGFFGISASDEWGEVRQRVSNAVVLMDVLSGYPFPSPISVMPGVWYEFARKDLQTIINQEGQLTPEVARFAATLVVLMHYDKASKRIVYLLKKKEKKRRRNAIIRAIGLSVVSIVFAIALPAVVAAGVQAVQTALDVHQAREAAKDMVKAAKQFAATDAAFSKEVEKSAEIIDAWAAREEKQAPPTEEETAALAEDPEGYAELTPEALGGVQPAPEMGPEFPTTELLIGGGVAAGLAAVLLAVLK